MPGLAMHHPRSVLISCQLSVMMFHLRSLSPVNSVIGEELSAALRRSRRRPGHLDKQVSSDSQDLAESEAALDRVRFDDNVSFIEAISPDNDSDKLRPSKVRTDHKRL